MIPGIDPKVDLAFKKVFGSEAYKDLTVSLINAVLTPPPDRRVVSVQLLNPYSERMTLDDKLSVLDVKARDQRGWLFNLEMQMVAHAAMAPRFLYYWAKVYSQQLVAGENYTDLRPAISICFVNGELSRDWPSYLTRFRVLDSSGKHCLTGDLEFFVIELPKFETPLERLREPLDFWLYLLKNGNRLDADSPPAPLNRPDQRRALEVLKMLSQSELEREQYESRLRAQMDRDTLDALRREAESKLEAATGLLHQRQLEIDQCQLEIERCRIEIERRRIESEQRRIESEQRRIESEQRKTEIEQRKTEIEQRKTEIEQRKTEIDSMKRQLEAVELAREEAKQKQDEALGVAKLGLSQSIRSNLRLLNRPVPDLDTLMRKDMESLRLEADQLSREVSCKFDGD